MPHKSLLAFASIKEKELPDSLTSRAILWSIRVAKPKIPYWGTIYHIRIRMSIVCLGIFIIIR